MAQENVWRGPYVVSLTKEAALPSYFLLPIPTLVQEGWKLDVSNQQTTFN